MNNQIKRNNFLRKLANICDQYDVTFRYTTDDDGIHICMGGDDIYVGWLSENAADELRAAVTK